ncbi:MAG: hypothetical protein IIY94_08735 [Oscillospiraceae bacterium]|nr:hypothetical protein [Oscillospiraceae bacterium]
MKKTIFLFAAVLVLLAACSKAPESGESAQISSGEAAGTEAYELKVPPEDRNQAFAWQYFVETLDNYYYGLAMENGGFIYFCPRGGKTFFPLCNKPNCKHENSDCNAYYGDAFGYYDGALYALEMSTDPRRFDIVKMKLDGSDHQKVAEIEISEMGAYSFLPAFHHGKLYLYSPSFFTSDMENQEDRLIIMDLADYSRTDDSICTEGNPLFQQYYKEKMYGQSINMDDNRLFELNTVTGEITTPIPISESGLCVNGLYATDATLYYLEGTQGSSEENKETETNSSGFYEYDINSGTIKNCGMPVADIQYALYDEDYIYATSFRRNHDMDITIYILTRDYQLVDQIESTEGLYIAAVTSDRIFFADYFSNTAIDFYLDKSQIGSGSLQLIPMDVVG